MRRLFARLASLGLVFVSVVAASSGCAGNKYDFVGDYCGALAPCCAAAGRGTSGSTCKQLLAGSVATSDEGAEHRCVDAVRAAVASKKYCTNLSDPSADAACAGVLRSGGSSSSGGPKTPGTPCASTSECASAADGAGHCSGPVGGQSGGGVCQIWKTGKDGDAPCIGTKSGNSSEWSGSASGTVAFLCDVGQGTYCDFSAETMGSGAVCRTKQGPGGACKTGEGCVAEAYCDSSTSACAARLGVGATCSTSNDICAPTAFCEQASSTCKARAPDGTPCTGSLECLGGECHNGTCATSAGLGGFALAFLCGN